MENLPIITLIAIFIALYSTLPEFKQIRVYYVIGGIFAKIGALLAFDFLLLWIINIFIVDTALIQVIQLLNLSLILFSTAYFLNLFFKVNLIENSEKFENKFNELIQKEEYYYAIKILEENYEIIFAEDNNLFEGLNSILLEYKFGKQISLLNPYFGLKILIDDNIRIDFRRKFAENYLIALLTDTKSILYQEFRNIDNIDYRYEIDIKNKISYNIFNDITLCNDLNLYLAPYKSIIKSLEQFKDYIYFNNKFFTGSEELSNDPVLVGLKFYDVMISEAIFQDLKWHINVYDYFNLIDHILDYYENLDNINVDLTDSAYSFFIKQIFSNLSEYMSLLKWHKNDLKEKLPKLENTLCVHQNDNIIKSSIICTELCLKRVLRTAVIPYDLKKSIIEQIMFDIYEYVLDEDEFIQDYGKVLENCFLNLAKKDPLLKNIIAWLFNPPNIKDFTRTDKEIHKTEEIKEILGFLI